MAVNLKGRSFLTLMDFTPEEIRYMLDLAHDLKAKKRAGILGETLKGKNVVLLFEKTSTRTRCAFETGALEDDEVELAEGVILQQQDIRALQLAKAAIAAGIETLLTVSDTDAADIESFYIAGGFGSHLNIESAVRIGLIPEKLSDKVQVIGNAALAGATQLLLDQRKLENCRQIAKVSSHKNLGGDPLFNECYVDQMFFPD